MDTVVVFLSAIIFILTMLNVFLLFYFYKTNKKFDLLLEGGKIKDLKDVFLKQIEKEEEQNERIKEIVNRIKELETVSEKTIQKVGIVRFNPFSSLGGNQSFVVALLDKNNNGFVISSLFIKEGSRIYTKTIAGGKSDYALSKEEQEAITRAVKV